MNFDALDVKVLVGDSGCILFAKVRKYRRFRFLFVGQLQFA